MAPDVNLIKVPSQSFLTYKLLLVFVSFFLYRDMPPKAKKMLDTISPASKHKDTFSKDISKPEKMEAMLKDNLKGFTETDFDSMVIDDFTPRMDGDLAGRS